MESKEKIYYGVYTDIGFGIFTTLELSRKLTTSANERHIHKFNDIKYAGIYALTGYNAYHSALKQPVYKEAPDPYKLDKLYLAS